MKFPRLTAKQKVRVHKWIALLSVCHYASYGDRQCKGNDLQHWIKKRLIRDYGFDNNCFAEQIDSPKFSSAYNSAVRDLGIAWTHYLGRLEGDTKKQWRKYHQMRAASKIKSNIKF